jgi:hypothetical protein
MGNGRGRRSTLGCARPTHASICLNLHILITPSDFLLDDICRYPPRIRRLGAGLLVSRHARYIHLTCQRRSLDDYQSRYSKRPRVCLCLGVRSRSCHLVRNLVTRKPTTDTDTRTFSPFSLRFWDLCRSVSPRIPDDSNLQNTTWKMCLMSFSTGKPHPLASRPTLELMVAGAPGYNLHYNVSNAEVIGDYTLCWVRDLHTLSYTLSAIYLIAWKEGRVTEVRL